MLVEQCLGPASRAGALTIDLGVCKLVLSHKIVLTVSCKTFKAFACFIFGKGRAESFNLICYRCTTIPLVKHLQLYYVPSLL